MAADRGRVNGDRPGQHGAPGRMMQTVTAPPPALALDQPPLLHPGELVRQPALIPARRVREVLLAELATAGVGQSRW